MVSRFTGASLGLLAFAITTLAGLMVGNPPGVILSRSILALFLFCGIGLLLGRIAQVVVGEYERGRIQEVERRHTKASVASPSVGEGRMDSKLA